MLVNLHAILLALCPVLTIAGLFVCRRRVPTSWNVLGGWALAVGAMVIAWGINQHLCDEGTPRTQWIIPGLCLIAVMPLVSSRPWRRLAALLLLVAMLGLSCHFTDIVHESDWTGNPSWPGMSGVWLRSQERTIEKEVLSEVKGDPNMYPAGWLRDLPVKNEILAGMTARVPGRRVLHPAWHSWLTGLYRRSGVEQDVWYPGGKLIDGLTRLEYRDRAQPVPAGE